MSFRRLSRYQIPGPTAFTWNDGEEKRQGTGWVRDLNAEGAYIYSLSCPPARARTNLEVILPPLGKLGRIFKIQMDAHVVRVETNPPEKESAGFAVRCEHVALRVASKDGSEETFEDLKLDPERAETRTKSRSFKS